MDSEKMDWADVWDGCGGFDDSVDESAFGTTQGEILSLALYELRGWY